MWHLLSRIQQKDLKSISLLKIDEILDSVRYDRPFRAAEIVFVATSAKSALSQTRLVFISSTLRVPELAPEIQYPIIIYLQSLYSWWCFKKSSSLLNYRFASSVAWPTAKLYLRVIQWSIFCIIEEHTSMTILAEWHVHGIATDEQSLIYLA